MRNPAARTAVDSAVSGDLPQCSGASHDRVAERNESALLDPVVDRQKSQAQPRGLDVVGGPREERLLFGIAGQCERVNPGFFFVDLPAQEPQIADDLSGRPR